MLKNCSNKLVMNTVTLQLNLALLFTEKYKHKLYFLLIISMKITSSNKILLAMKDVYKRQHLTCTLVLCMLAMKFIFV